MQKRGGRGSWRARVPGAAAGRGTPRRRSASRRLPASVAMTASWFQGLPEGGNTQAACRYAPVAACQAGWDAGWLRPPWRSPALGAAWACGVWGGRGRGPRQQWAGAARGRRADGAGAALQLGWGL